MLQVDGFNRALSARSGGKGLGRLLTFGRSPKPASAGGATPSTPENLTLSMDDMLLYSEVCVCVVSGGMMVICCVGWGEQVGAPVNFVL